MMKDQALCPLASSSKGNSWVLRIEDTTLLIDCGLSFRNLQKRLEVLELNIEEIDAVLITHEHLDHITGLKAFPLHVPIICNRLTAKQIYQHTKKQLLFSLFETAEMFPFHDLQITPFNVPHDAVDPVGFRIESSEIKIGFCTDLGTRHSFVSHYLEGIDYLVIESNYEPSLLLQSNRSPIYKERVMSALGHLSNQEASQLLKEIAPKKGVYLAHLSQDSNTPNHALAAAKMSLSELQDPFYESLPILVASSEIGEWMKF